MSVNLSPKKTGRGLPAAAAAAQAAYRRRQLLALAAFPQLLLPPGRDEERASTSFSADRLPAERLPDRCLPGGGGALARQRQRPRKDGKRRAAHPFTVCASASDGCEVPPPPAPALQPTDTVSSTPHACAVSAEIEETTLTGGGDVQHSGRFLHITCGVLYSAK